jgi:gas vesicle protein
VGDATSSLGSSVSDAAQRTPEQIRAGTQGSPLAAGLIAFGAGMLAAALFPASQAETQVATRLRENADMLEPAKEALTESVQQVKENLAPAAQDAAQQVKDSAAAAVSTTADQAKQSGSEVADQTKDTTAELRDHSADRFKQVRDQ